MSKEVCNQTTERVEPTLAEWRGAYKTAAAKEDFGLVFCMEVSREAYRLATKRVEAMK